MTTLNPEANYLALLDVLAHILGLDEADVPEISDPPRANLAFAVIRARLYERESLPRPERRLTEAECEAIVDDLDDVVVATVRETVAIDDAE